MFKNILVPVIGHKADAPALEAALRVGRLFDASIDCLQIRAGAAQIIRSVGASQFHSHLSNTELLGVLQKQAQEANKAARATIERFRAEHQADVAKGPASPGISLEWHDVEGDAVQETISHARFNDLLVLAKADDPESIDTAGFGTILMSCGRPVLLMPANGSTNLSSTIVIAWKETAEAARAVTASMPLLHKAGRVIVLSVDEAPGDPGAAAASAGRLADQLKKHGLKAEAATIAPAGRAAPEAMLDAVQQRGADLLVMGAYGHSRAREMVFGGFTRHVLNAGRVPVLLFH